MELSFGILLGSAGLALISAGGAWAHLALGVDRPMYRSDEAIALGIPSIGAALLACVSLFLPAFDVAFGTHIAAAVLAVLAALVGLSVSRGATITRGVLWPLAALVEAYALTQAIGIA